jgi:hypothetical protein
MMDIHETTLALGREYRPESPIIPALEICLRENKARILLARLADSPVDAIEQAECQKLLQGLRDPLWSYWSTHARPWLERNILRLLGTDPTRARRTLWS